MIGGLTERYFDTVPTRRVLTVRTITFGYATAWLVVRSRYVLDVADLPERRFAPVGVLSSLDGPPSARITMLIWAIGIVACGATALGRRVRLAAPIGAFAMLVIATQTSSYGQIFHTEHLVVIHLFILATAAITDPDTGDTQTSGWPLRLMMTSVVVVYVVAGVAKLRLGGHEWITGDVLRGHVAADNLRKLLLDDLYSPIGGWLAGVDWIWLPIALLTMVVELGAPLALIPGRIRIAWVLTAWAFHVGVLVLMAISFPYQLFGVAYLAFFQTERISDRLRSWRDRRSRQTRAARRVPNIPVPRSRSGSVPVIAQQPPDAAS